MKLQSSVLPCLLIGGGVVNAFENLYDASYQVRFSGGAVNEKSGQQRLAPQSNPHQNVFADAGNMVSSIVESADLALEKIVESSAEAFKSLSPKVPRPQFDDEAYEERITHPDFEGYQIRLKSPSLCDPDVKQYSGYLDISDKKHLFFWFFESRSDPKKDPLVMWLNGGPGCSSSTGLLFELGPCKVADEGESVKYNPHSWNNRANMLFLDQPVQVGYSWSDGESVSTTADAAKDVYAFMQLFYSRFEEYRNLDFNVAAESYGGHYAPNIGSYINQQNKELTSGVVRITKAPHYNVPLKSLLIGNGLTEPSTQFAAVPDFSCEPADTAIFSNATCDKIRSKVSSCQRLTKFCYDNPSRFSCIPADLYCWGNIAGPIQQVNVNPYDVRRSCDRSKDGDLCYKQMGWMETYLNKPEVKKALGAHKSVEFESCNMQVNQGFVFTGDRMHNSAAVIPQMIEDGIRVLVYAGDKDFMCNWIGNKNWVLGLNTTVQAQLNEGKDTPFIVNGTAAGEVRRGGRGAGQFTYLRVFNSGHMVPYDQPEAALEMFNRWLDNKSLGDE